MERGLTGNILSIAGDVPVDYKPSVVNSSISRSAGIVFLEVLIVVGLHAYIYRGKCVCTFSLKQKGKV